MLVTSSLCTAPPTRYADAVLVGEDALHVIWQASAAAYTALGHEWGGLLWGEVCRAPDGRIVPVVVAATSGQCRSTPVSCEILPASWEEGRATLRDAGLGHLRNIGDWHSHPGFGVFLSQHADEPSFWAMGGHVPAWMSAVLDPLRRDIGFFAKASASTYRRLPAVRVPAARLTSLNVEVR